jgi:hypothetical protein
MIWKHFSVFTCRLRVPDSCGYNQDAGCFGAESRPKISNGNHGQSSMHGISPFLWRLMALHLQETGLLVQQKKDAPNAGAQMMQDPSFAVNMMKNNLSYMLPQVQNLLLSMPCDLQSATSVARNKLHHTHNRIMAPQTHWNFSRSCVLLVVCVARTFNVQSM